MSDAGTALGMRLGMISEPHCKTKTAGNPAPRLMKVKEAARYLSISPWTLRKLVQTQQLRIVKLDDRGPWLIDTKDLDHFIEGRKEYF